MTGFERVYAKLLRLYPASFREEYGDELAQALRDRLAERRYAGWSGRMRLCLFLAGDLLRSLPLSHVRSGRRVGGRGDWWLDVRYAVRGFARRPGFFAAAVLTLGLGVGASTTMFSVADGVALRPLPYPDSDRLVVAGVRYAGDDRPGSVNPQDFRDVASATRSVRHLAASRLQSLTLLEAGEPSRLESAGVSASYFDVLGVRPVVGRAFTEAEDARSAEPVAVLSWGLWQRRFGGDRGVIGRSLEFDGYRFTVIGVMPRRFHPPEAIYHGSVELWFPLSFVSDDLEQRESAFLQAIGRLANGVRVAAASAELERISAAIAAEHPESEGRTWAIEPLRSSTVGDVGTTLVVLLGAVGFVLLIACANVANLQLVRATTRYREISIRGALVRLLLVESIVLSVVAAGLAVLLAYVGVAAFRATNPGDLPRLAEVTVDVRVLGFALAVSLVTGVIFGLIPALGAHGAGRADTVRDGSALSASRERNRLRGALIVAQTAVALVLLAGAGLLIHSFANLNDVDPGFEAEGAVWMQVRIPGTQYPTPEARHAFFTTMLNRFASLPGVEAVGGSENMPMGRNSSGAWISPEGLELAAGEDPPDVEYNRATEGFFEALRTPVVRGRAFTSADDLEAEPVAIVNEALAARFWPDADPLGSRLKFGRPESESPWMRVVGVVADLHQRGLGESAEPQLYVPWRQSPRIGVAFVVRSDNQPGSLLRAMKEQVWAVDPTLPIEEYGTLESKVAGSIVEARFYTLLLSVFAALALALAFIGMYGTIAYSVGQRTREIGVRIALGARPTDVVRLMIGRGMMLAGAGLVIGMLGTIASTGVLSGFVFGVSPRDPATLALTAATLAGAALLACWLPARRASRLDPARTLRMD